MRESAGAAWVAEVGRAAASGRGIPPPHAVGWQQSADVAFVQDAQTRHP
ncbi:hypothetical protein [Agromyces sp. Leaf222]|nr:hypothetical protein [Agromyces sp. Leaf222]